MYMNYHKHTHVSSIFGGADSNAHAEDYMVRAMQLGHTSYFTTEHGSGGDIFEAFSLCRKYNLKCIFGMEAYIVPDNTAKDNSNYHMIVIPKTNEARKKVNLISSHASMIGFYRRPRLSLDELLTLDSDDVFLTTACISGLLKDQTSIEQIFIPLYMHFGKNLMLEVQNHNVDVQKAVNAKAIMYSRELGLHLIAANDSHYINPQDREERAELMRGKNISYDDEDLFVLDYPDEQTMARRFEQQNVLTKSQIAQAIEMTNIFDDCESLELDYEIKMPTIYSDLTLAERMDLLEKKVWTDFDRLKVAEHLTEEEVKVREDGIKYELKTVRDTNDVVHTADYFLFNERNVDLAVNKYHGVLSRGGRGSAGSFYINKVLGITQIDRFTTDIPIYPDRFASTARLLENRALPDIDFNCESQEPFIAASRELLGENSVYPMVAYGTMQLAEAFRNVCRSHGLTHETYNEVGKDIEHYRKDPEWKDLIKEAERYVGTIVSASVHPCAFLLSDKNILEEYGVTRIGDKLCVLMTSGEADEFKFLKNDYLIVLVWKLISETFKEIGQDIIPVSELIAKTKDDARIWKLIADGITCTLNQIDSDNGMQQAMTYKLQSVEDGAKLTAAIRPSFNSWRNLFLTRSNYSTGSDDLDQVLAPTNHFILFQESLMSFFEWLDITPAESIGLIKKISKKKIKPEDFDALADRLHDTWNRKTGKPEQFNDVWGLVQSCMSYGFCSAHAYATSIDMLYGAYLKVNYPYEYYTVCFNNYSGDMVRTNKLAKELTYFGIKLSDIAFGKSHAQYSYDKANHQIIKGIRSIKFINTESAEELYEIGQRGYTSFIDVLYAMRESCVNARQRNVLIELGFFRDFGDPAKLQKLVESFELLDGKKSQAYSKAPEELKPYLKQYSETATLPRVEEIDVERYIRDHDVPAGLIDKCIKYKYIDKPNGIKEPNGYSTKRAIKALEISDDEQWSYATKIVDGRYQNIKTRELLKAYEKDVRYEPRCITDKIHNQIEYLGYLDITVSDMSKRAVVVTQLDTKYTPRFVGYSLRDGQQCQLCIRKEPSKYRRSKFAGWDTMTDKPVAEGDVIYISKFTKLPRQRKTENGWEDIPNEFNWWASHYTIIKTREDEALLYEN